MARNQENLIHLTVILVFLIVNTNGALITVKNNKVKATDNNDSQLLVHELSCSGSNGFCLANELKLNKTHRHFIPVSSIPAEQVKVIYLGGHPLIDSDTKTSVMHTLTSDLCRTFPNVKIIDAKYLGLQEIEEDALQLCTNLEAIYLAANNLQNLNQNIFKHNKYLEKIRLEENSLNKIDLNLFEELRHLNELGFDGQLLRNDFHVNKVRHRGIIKLVVRFDDQSIMELDEIEISASYPYLSSFIPCYREPTTELRLLHQNWKQYAKLYCFERPGNWDQDGDTLNDSSIAQNVI